MKIVGLYIAALALAALLTPAVAEIVKSGWPHISEAKVFDRLRAAGLLLALPVLWKWTGLKTGKDLGWQKWKTGAGLMMAGAGSVGALGIFLAMGKPAAAGFALAEIAGLCAKGVAVGLVVALLEETVFRGILQRIWVKGVGLWAGVILTAAIFGWLHGRPETGGSTWELAWRYVSEWPANFPVMMWVNLTLFGAALGFLYEKGKSLWWPIGFHAGVVAAMLPMSALLHRLDPTLDKLFLLTHPATSGMLMAWAVWAAWMNRRPKA